MNLHEKLQFNYYRESRKCEYPDYRYYNNLMRHGVDRMDEYREKA